MCPGTKCVKPVDTSEINNLMWVSQRFNYEDARVCLSSQGLESHSRPTDCGVGMFGKAREERRGWSREWWQAGRQAGRRT